MLAQQHNWTAICVRDSRHFAEALKLSDGPSTAPLFTESKHLKDSTSLAARYYNIVTSAVWMTVTKRRRGKRTLKPFLSSFFFQLNQVRNTMLRNTESDCFAFDVLIK
jgi:hypothetical protein